MTFQDIAVGPITRLLGRLRRDHRGNVLMIFGLALVPMTFVTGMGIDYSRAARLQTKMNAIADAAALAAVTTPMMNQCDDVATGAAAAMFKAQAAALQGVTFNHATDATYVTESFPVGSCPVLSRQVKVTYKAKSLNSFSGILGLPAIDIAGSSQSYASKAPYKDIHVVLDTSQSMGLASTDAGAATLFTATKAAGNEGCQFACHAIPVGDKVRNDILAAQNNVELRVDVLRKATKEMIQSAIDGEAGVSYYQFALYKMQSSLTPFSELTSDLSSTMSKVSSITLEETNSNGPGDTNIPDMLSKMKANIKVHGNGMSREKASAFLFIVTDGVSDVQNGSVACAENRWSHCTGPITDENCTQYKNAGITVGVVYTTYLPIYANPETKSGGLDKRYAGLVDSFKTRVPANLQKCASAGWYFEAKDGPSIHTAMQKLFAQAAKNPLLLH